MSKRGGNVWIPSTAPVRPVRAPVAPLDADWSPAGILHELYRAAPAGDEARRLLAALNVQLRIDEFHAAAKTHAHDCADHVDPDDPEWHVGCVPEHDAVPLADVLTALRREDSAVRERLLAALDL